MRWKLTVVALTLVAGACDRGSTLPTGGFPTCTPVRKPAIAPVRGLRLPPGAVVYRSRPTGKKLIQVRGYIGISPIRVREFYERLQTKPRYRFFLLEDEVIEAEVFFTDGTWRNFVKARTLCEGRTELYALVAPEDYGEKINLPPRTASPTP